MDVQSLNQMVVNGLRLTIKSHGPITKHFIGSAAKRIVGIMASKWTPEVVQELQEEILRAKIAELEREVNRQRQRAITQAKVVRDLVEKCRMAGVLIQNEEQVQKTLQRNK